jgi:hypothetical protein
VCLIELGRRSRLSGLFVAHEVRLDPEEKRPVCDALVVIQYGTFNQPNLVPWSSDPAIEGEGRVRFAIEADNDTEPLGVIAGKARAYRRLVEDNAWAAWWQQRHGPPPIPLWVVPSKARAQTVHNQWKRAWPDGRWLIATDEGLQHNEMLSWERRNEAYVTIGFKPLQPIWAALKLPWRILRAIWRWHEGLDYELAANLRLFVFTLALVAGGAMLVLTRPAGSLTACPPCPRSRLTPIPMRHPGQLLRLPRRCRAAPLCVSPLSG